MEGPPDGHESAPGRILAHLGARRALQSPYVDALSNVTQTASPSPSGSRI